MINPALKMARPGCHAYLKVTGQPDQTGKKAGSCHILEEYSTYPLRLLTNSNHACVLGFGGGSVSGDTANMKVELVDEAFFL
jgi:urease accessory protein UreH